MCAMDADFVELHGPAPARHDWHGLANPASIEQLSTAARAFVTQLDTGEPPTVSAQSGTPPRDEEHRVTRHTKFHGDTAAVDVHLVMRLLLASHDLDAVAKSTDSGELSADELVRAARSTRTAAVDLVSAWYGGGEQMRRYAEALLAAAASA